MNEEKIEKKTCKLFLTECQKKENKKKDWLAKEKKIISSKYRIKYNNW